MENSKNNQHSATSEVLSAVNALADRTDKQFEDVLEAVNIFADETRQEFINVRNEMAKGLFGLDSRMVSMESKMVSMGSKMVSMESGMVTVDKIDEMEGRLATKFVTKAYLDDKLADQTSEIFLRLDRRQDKDRNFKEKLVGVISGHSLITPGEASDLKELI